MFENVNGKGGISKVIR